MDFSLDECKSMQINHLGSEKSPKMSLPTEGNDTKYVSGLSTILVATIQEAKDRISQVEYIFCSQLYPNFQKNSKCYQELYSEARAVAEHEWKERVSDLKNQLNGAIVEKEQALEDCKTARTENMRLLGRVAELEEMLATKTKEVDEGLQLYANMVDLVQSKSSVVISKEKEMKVQEEKINILLEKLRGQEEKFMTLSINLQEKIEEVNKSKEELIISEKEKKDLANQLENMEVSLGDLRNALKRKTIEVQDAKQLQEQLVEQVNRNNIELINKDQLYSACEKEKQALLSRISHFANKVEEYQHNIKNGISVMPTVDVLAKQLERKNSELSVESQKRRDVVAAYKKLKSQQNFLLKKLGLTTKDMLLQMEAEAPSDQLSNDSKNSTPPEVENGKPVNNVLGAELNKVKKEVESMENSDDEISGRLNQMSNSRSPPGSTSPSATNWTTTKIPGPSAGMKRPASGWRETRSRQSPGGADPHDDFLDTPYDNIRGNLIKGILDNQQDVQTHKSKEACSDHDDDDDETQDMRPKPVPDRQVSKAPRVGPKDFKYVEPVRKKAERENLNGVECKQCKKFYDAVHGDVEGKDGEINKHNLRCEHHEGVSRHRYRYVPPMTPEGFWNIGFDTEN